MSTDASPPALTEERVAQLVEDLRHELAHPDTLDRALREYVLSEWVRELSASGLATADLDLPVSFDARKTKDTETDDGSYTQCHHHFISVLGHELISWDTCQSGSGTGSGHSSGGVSTTGQVSH